MKKFILTLIAFIFAQHLSIADEIKFDNQTYKLKFSTISQATKGYGNEYYKDNDNPSNWSKMVGIYHYPNIDNPLKYAENFNKTIETTDNCLFLKLIENKSSNKAVLSFLTNGTQNSKKYFEYDVYKFEKYNKTGMVVSKYASKYYFNNNDEISKIAKNIKQNNDKYLELFAVSPTPSVLEKEIISN